MRVLLIGAGGQLGTDMVLSKPEGIEVIEARRADVDITDGEKLRQAILDSKAQYVINTAAFHKTDQCEDEPDLTFKVNAIAVRDMAEACLEAGAGLFHISTDYVFDGGKKPEPYNEEDIPNPLNTYGVSKYAGEIFLRNTLEKHYIVRVASLYGKAGASGKGGNFVYSILQKAREGQTLRVVDDISMTPTYTADAAREIWSTITEQRPYGLYHVTNSGSCSWYEFAKAIVEFAGLKAEVVPVPHTEYPTKARRPLWSPLNSIKGVKLRPWQEALRDFVASVA